MANATKNITKRIADALCEGQIIWDSTVKGFGIRAQRAKRVYFLKTRILGRQRWIKIGTHGSPWTVETARKKAKELLGEIAAGRDPVFNESETRRSITVKELSERFLQEHVKAKRKLRTQQSYRDLLERLALPELGNLSVKSVTQADIARLHHSHSATPYQANRLLAVLRKMFSFSEQYGHRPVSSNPCVFIDKFKESPRERFLSEIEIARLGKELAHCEENTLISSYAASAVRLLLLTGARLNEILTLRWDYIDFRHQLIVLPDSKTGKKTIYLSDPALKVLEDVKQVEGNPFVIVGQKNGSHLINLQKPWCLIRKKCGLMDVRLHDLRHTFASFAAMQGVPIALIGKLIGHASSATTERYAHFSANPLIQVNQEVGGQISLAMRANSTDKIVFLPDRRGMQNDGDDEKSQRTS